jgi:hypothetical protein
MDHSHAPTPFFPDSYFKLGDIKKAESQYEEWLKQDPKWGWGWIGRKRNEKRNQKVS